MLAAYISEVGPASSILYGDVPTPSPGLTDVLVRVETVAVNRVDTLVRSGSYRTPLPLPFAIGRG